MGTFNNGLSGLLAAQRAIATTSHNIANANTEGYSRQRIELEARPATALGFGNMGNGVEVSSITRIQDQFIQSNIQSTNSDYARVNAYHEMVSRIDNLLADSNAGLSDVQSSFFNAVQDLNNTPTSSAARQAMLSSAEDLAGRYNTLQGQLDTLQSEVDNRMGAAVQDINTMASDIAELNKRIVSQTAKAGGGSANDLLDQRDQLLTDLSELIGITTVEQDDGALNVFIGNGLNLVAGGFAQELQLTPSASDPEKMLIGVKSGTGVHVVSDQLTGGMLGGLMEFSRDSLDGAMNELGRLANVLGSEFNEQHQQGLDSNGNQGKAFFNLSAPDVIGNTRNTGGAEISATLVDAQALSASDYKLDFNGADYTLTRLSDNTQVTGTALPMNIDGVDIELSSGAMAAGDSFLIRPNLKAARDFSVAINNANSIAMASPLRSDAPVSNLGQAEITAPEVTDIDHANFNDRIEIRFNTPPDTFDVVDLDSGTTLTAGVAYSDGDTLAMNGWSVRIDGAASSGDVLRIEPNDEGLGNNRNGLLLAELQNASLIEGQSSLEEGYAGLMGKIGSQTRQADLNSQSLAGMLENVQQSRENLSGVNLDEEAINLTRYQQAYQASAQVISVAEGLFQSLLSALN